jgi:MscS family membrane protein
MVMVRKFINGTIWVIAILLVLSNYGVNITSAVAGLGLGGLAVAMAAKDTLSNMFGGIIIFIDRPFRIGNVIEFNGEFGVVEEIGLRSLRIRTLNGFLLTIPNSMFAQSGVKNLSEGQYRRVELILGLVYDTSAEEMKKAKSIVHEVITSTDGVVEDREPVIYFDNFGDSSLDLKAYYWTVFDWNEHVMVKDRINMEIKRRFDQEGIGFAFPTMTLDIPKISRLPGA